MISTEETIQKATEEILQAAGIIPGKKVCVAYSGGPDSTVLLLTLSTLARKIGFSVCAAHVEHGLRPRIERMREVAVLVKVCADLCVPLYMLCLPNGYLRNKSGKYGGTEGAARKHRYDFLQRVSRCTGSEYIATGHTRDDQTETLIMRFFQGSGPEGLTGMRSFDPPLLRPLIGFRKQEILQYLKDSRFPHSIDSTNNSTEYLRNSVRHTILPIIRDVFPHLDTSLGFLATKMDNALEALRGFQLQEIQWDKSKLTGTYKHDLFFRYPLHFRIQLIYELYNILYPEAAKRLPYRFLLFLCASPSKKINHVYGQGHGVLMEKRGDTLFWRRVVVQNAKKSYLYRIKEGLFFIDDTVKILVHADFGNDVDEKRERLLTVQSSPENMPCVMRSRREGDRILQKGGTRKVKDLLDSSKQSVDGSYHATIIEDRRGILAVVFSGREMKYFKSRILMEREAGEITYQFDFL